MHEDFVLANGTIDSEAFATPGGLSVLGIFLDHQGDNSSTKETAWFEVGSFNFTHEF